MTTVTEKAKTAAETEPKATAKPTVRARAPHVAPTKGEPGKKAAARNAARTGKKNARPAQGKKARSARGATSDYEREYKGKKYVLTTVQRDGKAAFQLKGGKMFNSMTAAAKSVTGYKAVSGPAYWGARKLATK